MTIKSLILGSAAALVSVSMGATAARAADAVVMADPEPVEYVRVCDAYGTGFFYIPGTETCMQISGYVFFQVGAEGFDGTNSPDFLTYGGVPGAEGWLATTRARLNVDVRSDTEWGTLRGYLRYQATWGNQGDGAVVADQAFIQLGGLRMGYTESVWNDSIGAGVAAYGSHSWGSMSYGDQQRHQISYSFGSDKGFAATISLEDDNLAGDGYVPDVVLAASYNQTWGAVWAKAGYDEDRGDGLGSDGFGVTAGLQYNIPAFAGSSLRLIGYYSDSDNAYSVISPVSVLGGFGAAEFSVLASYYHQFTPTLGASVGFQYFKDYYVPLTDVSANLDGYAAELAIVWTPVTQFEVRAEIYYDKVETLDGTPSGFLRVTRFF